LTDLTVEELVL